ncbi:MAG TPA: ABC transporter substrate-binding protein [Micromonosporaceae bacterium]|nr:ABC transporter substrate-binding protein [Micromonosporaceae bacterium]
MRRSWKGRTFLVVAVAVVLAAVSACSKKANTNQGPAADKVEVMSWWTGGGEEAGLNALIALLKTQHPEITFLNSGTAGGAGSNAKAQLATRLSANNPPDSYQRHAGKEIAADIKNGDVQDLTYLYDRNGWKNIFPKGLIDAISDNGKIYSVPVNIHRSNLMWYLPKTLTALGISGPPKTWDEFLTQAAMIKSKGKTALSIGPAWTQKHLLENVLLGELGTDKYTGLWNGSTDWTGADVASALKKYKTILSYSDIASAGADWQPAADRMLEGAAVYNVMGDWMASYLNVDKKLKYKDDYNVVASPGTDGVYNFLSDSFTLPVGAPHKAAAETWLSLCGSKEGQDAFNPLKGSVPARTDGDKSKYTGYLATALADWTNPSTKVVGSLTHGVVANDAWNSEIDTALGLFIKNGDAAAFGAAVKQSYEKNK